MRAVLEDLWSALTNQVTRGKVTQTGYSPGGARMLVQGVGLEGEIHDGLELLLPYGMSARPVGRTADYLVFQINASRDHKVAIGADDPAVRIPDLLPGEVGLRNYRGSQAVLRQDKIEVTAPLDDIDVTAAKGNVNVAATAGQVSLSSKGNLTLGVSAGNLAVNITGAAILAATGAVTLTGAAGQITANGNVLG